MPEFLEKIKEEIKQHPWEVGGGVLVAGGTVIFFIVKERMASASGSQQSNTSSELQADQLNGYELASLAGLPYGYIDPGSPTGGPGPGQPPPPPPKKKGSKLTTRERGSDTKTKTGVPLFQAIGSFGHSVTHIPYGAVIESTGPSVQGPNNKGHTDWWPVTYQGHTGWLSGYDIAHVGAGEMPLIEAHSIFTTQGLAPEMVGWQ